MRLRSLFYLFLLVFSLVQGEDDYSAEHNGASFIPPEAGRLVCSFECSGRHLTRLQFLQCTTWWYRQARKNVQLCEEAGTPIQNLYTEQLRPSRPARDSEEMESFTETTTLSITTTTESEMDRRSRIFWTTCIVIFLFMAFVMGGICVFGLCWPSWCPEVPDCSWSWCPEWWGHADNYGVAPRRLDQMPLVNRQPQPLQPQFERTLPRYPPPPPPLKSQLAKAAAAAAAEATAATQIEVEVHPIKEDHPEQDVENGDHPASNGTNGVTENHAPSCEVPLSSSPHVTFNIPDSNGENEDLKPRRSNPTI